MVDVETRHSRMEQMTLALKSATQKLRSYFQAHQVTMLTNQPLCYPTQTRSVRTNVEMSHWIEWIQNQVPAKVSIEKIGYD